GRGSGIDGAPGIAGLTLPPNNFDAQVIRTRHRGAWTIADAAARQAGADMKAEDGVRFWILQRAILDHRSGAPDFASERGIKAGALFGRLEDEFHRAWQLVSHSGKHLGRRH